MRPNDVRRRILADHRDFRGVLLSIEALSEKVLGGDDSQMRALRVEGETFHEQLLEHMRWEDRYLAPLLWSSEAWGEERAKQLERDHLEQRELLLHTLEGLRDPRRPTVALARTMVDLMGMLRLDMEEEDAVLSDSRLLQDDGADPAEKG